MGSNITAITTFCMNDEYVETCLGSFMKLFPNIPVVVVNNSPLDDLCTENLERVDGIKLINTGKNMGHGQGLLRGMEEVKTKYVLIFDSDVLFKLRKLIPDMLSLMDDDTYGVGFVMWHGMDGKHCRPHLLSEDRPAGAMKYLHPFCVLINVSVYEQYPKFDGFLIKNNKPHGAPMMSAMKAIYDAGKEHIIKLLPESSYVKCKYWHHESGGVRMILRKQELCK